MKLDNFKSFLGIEYGNSIDKAIELFGKPDDEYRNDDNHYGVYYYKNKDEDILSISFNKENNIIESMYLGQHKAENVWSWLEMHQINDEKASLLDKHIDEIIDMFGVPSEEEINDFIYVSENMEIDFHCPEESDFSCQRIFLNWYF
jgi:hypothetical protein